MNVRTASFFGGVLAFAVLAGSGCAASTSVPVDVSFRVEAREADAYDVPRSDVYLLMTGFDRRLAEEGSRVGTGPGCQVTEEADFAFPDESLAEVSCYFAGAGDVFQAHHTASGDIEVTHYDVAEVIDADAGSYSMQMLNPTSVYTFDL